MMNKLDLRPLHLFVRVAGDCAVLFLAGRDYLEQAIRQRPLHREGIG
jgi:hypothetical protein